MFAEECRRAIAACQRTGLDALAREVWRAYGANVLTEAEASELCEAIAARRAVPTRSPELASEKRRVGSRPRSSTSMERRRAWTASGWLPPAVAARFTMGEQAALGVVLAEVATTGRCELSHGAVGGRAGVSVSTVKRAIGEARKLGLVAVAERQLTWCRNLPNIVTVASAELRMWVATRGRGLRAARATGEGFRQGPPRSPYLLLLLFDLHHQIGRREVDGRSGQGRAIGRPLAAVSVLWRGTGSPAFRINLCGRFPAGLKEPGRKTMQSAPCHQGFRHAQG